MEKDGMNAANAHRCQTKQRHSIMQDQRITTMKDAQKLVASFAERNAWKDIPNIDKFDHLHEELIEMSQHLRYKSEEERIRFVGENREIFIDGIGDLFFGMCRLANQLGVDMEEAFNLVKKEILAKYDHKNPENNIVPGKE
jgi:NTP pyrophosphatase (non-canonical NTP hydrolase)